MSLVIFTLFYVWYINTLPLICFTITGHYIAYYKAKGLHGKLQKDNKPREKS